MSDKCKCQSSGGIEDNLKLPMKPFKVKKKTRKIMSYIFLFMVVAEASFLAAQAYKSFKTKSAGDIDRTAFFILLITNIFWMFYAIVILQGDVPILVSGALYTIGASLILTASFLYA